MFSDANHDYPLWVSNVYKTRGENDQESAADENTDFHAA